MAIPHKEIYPLMALVYLPNLKTPLQVPLTEDPGQNTYEGSPVLEALSLEYPDATVYWGPHCYRNGRKMLQADLNKQDNKGRK